MEEQLTRRLGISRAPLCEALRLLARRGLVEHVPRHGVRVATLSDREVREVRELYELRDVLDRFAIRAGISVGGESDLVDLRSALDTAPGRAGEAQMRRPLQSAMTCTLTPWRLCLPE